MNLDSSQSNPNSNSQGLPSVAVPEGGNTVVLTTMQTRLQALQDMLNDYSEQVINLNASASSEEEGFKAICQKWQELKSKVLHSATNLSNYYQEFQARFPELLAD